MCTPHVNNKHSHGCLFFFLFFLLFFVVFFNFNTVVFLVVIKLLF